MKALKSLVDWLWSVSLEDNFGSLGEIRMHLKDSRKQPKLEEAINTFKKRWPEIKSNCNSEPIFIFSAGWRSGSTLLQRLLMSSGKVIIWGEPYSHNGLIDHLSSPLKGITDTFPRSSWFTHSNADDPSSIVNDFTANFYPDIQYLIESHAAFLLNLFEKPAKANGVSRWGIKDVRLTIDHALYLNWIFPKSKFLFLYRNPYNAYKSFSGSYWYKTWPNDPVYTPKHFGTHWKNLMQGYISGYQKVNGMLLSYEDLCQETYNFEGLSEFVGFDVDSKIMSNKVKGNIKWKKDPASHREMKILKKVVDPIASELGYSY